MNDVAICAEEICGLARVDNSIQFNVSGGQEPDRGGHRGHMHAIERESMSACMMTTVDPGADAPHTEHLWASTPLRAKEVR